MNNICLMGRLSADVELKQTKSGVSVCSFRLAVNRPNVKDTTDWINCVAWRNTAEFISRYFRKGNMIAVTGYLTTRNYDDKSGNKRTAYEVVVDRADFCGEGKTASTDQAADGLNQSCTNTPELFTKLENIDGDLPF